MPDTCRYSAGRYLNLLSRARSVVASSAQTEFPVTWAYDKDSVRPWIAAAGASDVTVRADLAFDNYGDFEGSFSGGIPPGFTSRHVGSASSGQEAVIFTSGAKALKLITTQDADVSEVSIDYTVARGEELRIIAKMRTDGLGGTPTVACRVYDRNNRTYWNGTAWTTSAANAFSETSATFQAKAVTVPLARGQGDTSNVRISLRSTATAGAATRTTYVDEFFVYPTWDCGALIGHNVDSGSIVLVQGSSDGSAYSTVATPTHRRPSLYGLATARQTTRWAGVIIPGTNVDTLYSGEVIIAQMATPGSSWSNALPTTWMPRQLRQQTPSGRTHVTALSTDIPRRIKLDLELVDDSIRAAFRDDLALRTNMGEHYALVIPDTAVADVFYGRVTGGLDASRDVASDYEKASITIEEDGFPTVGLGV
jgi:hypothetical protein